jgi:uncharacterized membrane protein
MRDTLEQPTAPEQSHTAPSRMAILKHPVHPMLVVYPIALLSLVVVTDALYLWRREDFWGLASFWLSATGLAMGLLAAVVGTLDLFSIPTVRRHVSAWTHMIAAVMVLALAAAGVWLRWRDPVAAVWPWGMLVSTVTFGLVGVAGWLGGTLSFRHGIGVYGERDPGAGDSNEEPPDE